MEDQRNKFAPYPLPPQEGNTNGWLIDDANDSDLESTASNQPMSLTMEDIGNEYHGITFKNDIVEFRIDIDSLSTHGKAKAANIERARLKDARIVGAASRVARQGIYSAKSLTMGSASFLCQEEGWIRYLDDTQRRRMIMQLFEIDVGFAKEGEVVCEVLQVRVLVARGGIFMRNIKDNLCNAPILSLPDRVEDFVVYYDASNQGLGCVLMQRDKLIAIKRRWLELFSDYECEIKYHPGKENVVADALSRKERVKPRRVRAMAVTIQSGVKGLILAAQGKAFKDENVIAKGLNGTDQQMEKREDGSLHYMDRIWVPLVGGVRTKIMDEAHKMRYSVHPGADKMYYDLRDMYWWPGMKKEIAIYVSKCLTCAKVKAEHQRPSGILQQPEIHEWKWEKIAMDFVKTFDRLTKLAHFLAIREDYSMEKLARLYIDEIVARHGAPTTDGQREHRIQMLKDMLTACVIDFGGSWNIHLPLAEFSYNNSYHSSIRYAPFEALYGRKCRSPVFWAEIGDSGLIRPELVQETPDKWL
ncbi:putative reverse transcriptase domain-containing protein [Tanacetum coccineum]